MFDSGVGGLSVWHEIVQQNPFEPIHYIADSKYAPYGEKSVAEILKRSKRHTEFLLSKNVSLIVIACNTATTMTASILRESYDVPFVGIEPAYKPAALYSKRKKVGVLATKGTLESTLFNETYSRFGKDVETVIQVGKGLVQLIEAGKINSAEMRDLLSKYILPMVEKDVDHIVLGCTHYPFLRPLIATLVPSGVNIIDSGEAVAKRVTQVLSENQLALTSGTPSYSFYSNGNHQVMKSMLDRFLLTNAHIDYFAD